MEDFTISGCVISYIVNVLVEVKFASDCDIWAFDAFRPGYRFLAGQCRK